MEYKRDSSSGAFGGAREIHRERVSNRLNVAEREGDGPGGEGPGGSSGGGGRGPSLGSRGGAPFGGVLCRSSRYNKVQFHCCSIGRERAHVLPMSANSSFRVERRKRGNAQRASSSSYEAEGDRKL